MIATDNPFARYARPPRKTYIMPGFIGKLIIVLLFVFFGAYPFWWLWDGCVVHAVSFAKPLQSYWHAFGMLLFFSSFIVGSNGSKS